MADDGEKVSKSTVELTKATPKAARARLTSAATEVGFWSASKLMKHGALGLITPFLLFGFVVVSALAMAKGIGDLLEVSRPDMAGGVSAWLYIGMIVFLASASMWATLELALHLNQPIKRSIAIVFYVFLVLWSLGFGYGFWWSLLAGREATQQRLVSLENAIIRPVESLKQAALTLENDVSAVANESEARQKTETATGGSCDGDLSPKEGDGPLSKARGEITASVRRVTARIGNEWVAPLNAEAAKLTELRKTVASFSSTGATRTELTKDAFDTVGASAKDIGISLGTLYDGVAPSLQKELTDLSGTMAPGSMCPDRVLHAKLNELAAKLGAKPPATDIVVPDYVHGAHATAYAFDRLWRTAFAATPFLKDLEPANMALTTAGATPAPIRPAEPANRNDIIAFVAAIVVEFGIFVFTLASPRRPFQQADFARRARVPVQERLISAFRTFMDDDKVDARREFDSLLLHTGRRQAYVISPSFRSGVKEGAQDRELEHRRRFLQNVLIVLEESRAIDKTIHFGPLRRMIAQAMPWLETSRLFREALERLTMLGWYVRDEADFRLHRIRRGELLEVLMMLREDVQVRSRQEDEQDRASPRRKRGGGIGTMLSQLFASRPQDEETPAESGAAESTPKRSAAKRKKANSPLDGIQTETPNASRTQSNVTEQPVQGGNGSPPSRPADLAPPPDPFATIETSTILRELDDLNNAARTARQSPGTNNAANAATAEKGLSQLIGVLESRGLSRTPTTGKFNPYYHNAIQTVASALPVGAIVEVLRHGFFDSKGKLLRPADVTVSSGVEQPGASVK